MQMREFIKENRNEIRDAIERAYGTRPTNDDDTEQWILNDESLYQWAQSEGVPI